MQSLAARLDHRGPRMTSLAVQPVPENKRERALGSPRETSSPTKEAARVAVYDVAGRLVRTVVDEELPEGDHTAIWDGRDAQGQRVAGGTYFVRLRASGETQTSKVVFLGD